DSCLSSCNGDMIFAADTNLQGQYKCCLGTCSMAVNNEYLLWQKAFIKVESEGRTVFEEEVARAQKDLRRYTGPNDGTLSMPINFNKCDIEGDYYLRWVMENADGSHYAGVSHWQEPYRRIYAVNWDMREAACVERDCYTGQEKRGWFAADIVPQPRHSDGNMNNCCGDDPTDTGTYLNDPEGGSGAFADMGDWVCALDSVHHADNLWKGAYLWEAASTTGQPETVGDFNMVEHPYPYDIVSDGARWVACNKPASASSFMGNIPLWETRIIASPFADSDVYHDYLCFPEIDTDQEHYALGECHAREPSLEEVHAHEQGNIYIGYQAGLGDALPIAFEIEGRSNVRSMSKIKEDDPIFWTVEDGGVSINAMHVESRSVSGNKSLKIDFSVNEEEKQNIAYLSLTAARIQDWKNKYTYLQIPFAFTRGSGVDLILNYTSGQSHRIFDILRYSTNGYMHNQWHLLRIPLADIPEGRVSNITFVFDGQQYGNYYQGAHSFFLDRITLLSTFDEGRVFYCTHFTDNRDIETNAWIEDLDTYGSYSKGKEACNALEYANWTGTRCCGDDSNSVQDAYMKRSEFYGDTEAACWNGQLLPEDMPLQVYDLVLAADAGDSQYTLDCHDPEGCIMSIPPFLHTSELKIKSASDAYFLDHTGRKAKNTTRLADDLLLSVDHPQILQYNGTLMGCYSPYRHSKETDNKGHESAKQLLNDTNYHADDLLVDNGKCTVHGSYFCDPDGFWNDDATIQRPDRIYTDGAGNRRIQHGQGDHLVAANRTKLSQHYSDQDDFSCCPESYCWNGSVCIEDMGNEPSLSPFMMNETTGAGYRCVDGSWQWSTKKYDWNHKEFGYCAEESSCFVRVERPGDVVSAEDPLCVEDGYYIGDYMCDAGVWRTRTQFLAGYLLTIAEDKSPTEYELFCDHFEKTLNYVGVSEGRSMADMLAGKVADLKRYGGSDWVCDIPSTEDVEECVNHFCVLTYDDKTVLATSLNQPLDEPGSIGTLFELEQCEGVEGGFTDCRDGWRYHEDMGLLLYRSQGGFLEAVGSFLHDLIVQPAIDLFSGVSKDPEEFAISVDVLDYLSESTNFASLYVAQHGKQSVLGVRDSKWSLQEGRTIKYLGVAYRGFTNAPDVCSYVENFDSRSYYTDDFSCTETSKMGSQIFHVFSRSADGLDAWVDLTAVLRLGGQ
ncbi:MAG: hypothetical protein ACOCWQ_05640, partial [Nanoarchaeota archaeon]